MIVAKSKLKCSFLSGQVSDYTSTKVLLRGVLLRGVLLRGVQLEGLDNCDLSSKEPRLFQKSI